MNKVKISCCRICRESTWSDKVTFEFDGVWLRLYEFCVGLQVTRNGPQIFCKSCSDKLNDYDQFKQLCLQSEEMWETLSKTAICSLEKLTMKEEKIDYFDDFDYNQDDDDGCVRVYISNEDFPLTHEDNDEKIYEYVNNDQDNLKTECVDIIKKPLDQNKGGAVPATHEVKDENINEFVNNLKDKLGEICIDKINKPRDTERHEAIPVTHGIKDEKINELVENLKGKLGDISIKIKKPHGEEVQIVDKDEKFDSLKETCIDKMKKPLDKDIQSSILNNKCKKRKNDSTVTNNSKYSDKNDVFVINDKGKFEKLCIDKMKKVLDKDIRMLSIDNSCRKRKINSSRGTNHSKCLVKKDKFKNSNEKKLPKSSQIAQEPLGSSKSGVDTKKGPTTFFCGICEYSSTTSSEVDQHFVKHCEDNELHCKLCSFEGKDVADMALHRYTHINQKVQTPKCPLCPKKFRKIENIPIHYRSKHLKLKFNCKFCGKSMGYTNLLVHEQQHVAPKLKCDLCGLGFVSQSGLRNHMFTHKDENPYICEQCGRGFKTVNNIKQHIIYRHTKTKPETCTICNRQFKNNITLKVHMRERHSEKRFVCDVCNAGFSVKYILRNHIFVHHSDEKPYPCDRCNASYRSLKMLKAHKKSKHSGELPYKCANCGKRFSCITACKRHEVSGCQIP